MNAPLRGSLPDTLVPRPAPYKEAVVIRLRHHSPELEPIGGLQTEAAAVVQDHGFGADGHDPANPGPSAGASV